MPSRNVFQLYAPAPISEVESQASANSFDHELGLAPISTRQAFIPRALMAAGHNVRMTRRELVGVILAAGEGHNSGP